MAKHGRYGQLITNTVLFTAGKFISKLMVLAMMRFYTYCLTPAEYSTADLIVDMANLLIPIACLGISEGIFRNAAARTGDKQAFLTAGLAVLGVGSLAFLLLSPLICLIPLFQNVAWLIVLYVLVSNIHTVVSQYLCAIGRTRLFAAQGILNTFLTIVLNILFLLGFDMGVSGFVLSIVLADGLTTLLLVIYTRLWRSVKPMPWSAMKPLVRSMLTFCLPLIPSTLCWWVTGVSDRYMVAAMFSHDENGLYAAAYKIPTLLTYAVGIFDSAWRLSVAAEAEDREACRTFYTRVWRSYTTVAFLGGAVLILGSYGLSALLFDLSYRDAWVYVPVLTVATVFAGLDTFLGSVYFTSRRTKGSMWTALCGAVLNIGLNLVLIPPLGAMGASLATLTSYFAVCMLRLLTVHRLIAFNREIGRGAVNTLLLLLMAFSATMAAETWGSSLLSPGGWWMAAAGCGVCIAVFNARVVVELTAGGMRAVRRRIFKSRKDISS